MKKALIIAGVVFGIFLVICGISASVIWSQRNVAVELEEKIDAKYKANQSNYDNMWKTFKETAQVTDLQANQLKDTYQSIISGRYQDPNLLFKMVKEDNPKMDTSVYTKLQNEISAGRKQFDNNQKQIIDVVREYNVYVKKHLIMTFITGREAKNMDNYVVTSERTDGAFKSKKDEAIDFTSPSKK